MPSYRNRGAMEQQMADLLLHYRDTEHMGGVSANDVLQRALNALWQSEIGFFQPEPPHITGYVAYRPAAPVACADCGRVISEGWQALMSDG